MLTPYASVAGSSRPGVNFCAPGWRWLSIMAPKTRRLPPPTCRAISPRDVELALVLLGAVGVRAIDHQRRPQACALERVARGDHACFIVVRRNAAAQDDVAVGIAAGANHCHAAGLVHAQEVVRARGRLDRVARDLHAAVGAVLEADRRRDARHELAMHLAFGRARADRTPRDQVADVLRRDRVEQLAARRNAELRDVDQQLARDAKPSLMRQLSSRYGSLMRPFQPTVVRGFSKYTRITISRLPIMRRRTSASRRA